MIFKFYTKLCDANRMRSVYFRKKTSNFNSNAVIEDDQGIRKARHQ